MVPSAVIGVCNGTNPGSVGDLDADLGAGEDLGADLGTSRDDGFVPSNGTEDQAVSMSQVQKAGRVTRASQQIRLGNRQSHSEWPH